jgi:alpha-tubulin suppressor-like RCC1 family protein
LAPFRDVLMADGTRTFSAAVKKDGSVWFWGIPPGTPESASFSIPTPKMIEGLSNITAIAVGFKHILALRSDGTVWSWGVNDVGQLGVGAIGLFQLSPARQIPGLENVQSIATNGTLSLALKSDGTIWGWGDGGAILTGGTATLPVTSPIQINTISGVRQIASGGCTYAVKQDGTVWSWSDTFFTGQCGTGTTETNPPLAWLQVSGISDVRSIKTRFNNTIAVKNDGSLWAWGNNSSGQLADFTIERSKVPLRITSMNNVQAVGLGDTSCLALKTDGTVWFWGNGKFTPTQVEGLAGVKDIAAWSFVFAALMPDDTLQMWGNNNYSNLGNGIVGGDGALGPVNSLTVAATPIVNPDSRLLVFQQDVVITCETQGATIHYTTNGADPTQSDPGIPSGGTARVSKSGVLKARAFKSGLSPSKVVSATYVVLASDPGSVVELLLDADAGSEAEAAALDSVLATRGPFSIVNSSNLLNQGGDRNTRVIVFTRNFQLQPGETANSVKVELYDANGFVVEVAGEDVRSVPNTDLTQVTFRLSDNLAPGKYTAIVRAHGQTSNVGSITINN